MSNHIDNERREDFKNGLYIKIDLKEWIDGQFKSVNKKLEKLDELPCGVENERMKGIEGKINWIWLLISGIVLALITIGFSMGGQ